MQTKASFESVIASLYQMIAASSIQRVAPDVMVENRCTQRRKGERNEFHWNTDH